MTTHSKQKFRLKRSVPARIYLLVFISILSLFFYFARKDESLAGQFTAGTLIAVGVYLFLFNKTIVIDRIDRSITVFIDLSGLVISKTVAYIPPDAIVQCSDEYSMHNSGSGATCWLSIDIKEDNGNSILPLSLQKKLREHASYNRKVLVDIANIISRVPLIKSIISLAHR